MAMRVSYGSRATDLDTPRATVPGPRQIARPPCNSLAEALEVIRADIQAGEESAIPECTTSEVTLGSDAVLELHRPNIGPYSEGGDHDLPATFKKGWTYPEADEIAKSYPTATVDEITGFGNKEGRAVVQRAASRGIVAAVEVTDGFKYSMNNAWAAKDADGQRFSYICQDSMQNKDRHANGFTRTLKHLKGEHERGPRKPTYDCKGSVSIKCSMVRRTIDIFYRHYAIHSSVAERKQLPRPPRARTSTGGEGGSGVTAGEKVGLLGRLQGEESAYAPPPTSGSGSQGGSNIGRPLKRKRDEDTPAKAGKPLSLVELLKQSESAEKTAKSKTPAKTAAKSTSMHPPPMNYDLPSWQKPPPPPSAVQPPRATQPTTTAQPYQPPYQPTSQHTPRQPPMPIPRQHPPATQRPTYNQHPPASPYHYNPQPRAPPPPTPQTQQPQPTANTPLFSTLKPIRMETPLTLYSGRTRSSCTNCRYGKKKCDELRPVCGNCAKGGKYDCAYDGAYGYPATAGQQAQMGGWVAGQGQSPSGQMGAGAVGGGGGQGYGGQGPYQQYTPSQQTQAQHYPTQGPTPPMSQYSQQSQQAGGQMGASAPQGQREESPDPWFPKR